MRKRTRTLILAAALDIAIIAAIVLYLTGCTSIQTSEYEYQVHIVNGVGLSHLYTATDQRDAIEYIKFYQQSHGDMKIIRVEK